MADINEVQQIINNKISGILIDVREEDELDAYGFIPTAKNIPLSEFQEAFDMSEKEFEEKYGLRKPAKDTRLVLYCRSGGRSGQAANYLKSSGYNAENYSGSILEWSKQDSNVKAY